jgi:hypothetical protein
MLERATRSVEQTALIAKCPWATTASATAAFWPGGDLQRLLEDLGFERLLAETALQLPDLVVQGAIFKGRGDLLLGTGGRQRSLGRELAPAKELVGRHSMPGH